MGESKGLTLEFLICHKVKVNSLSRVRLFATPWTVAHHAPPSTEFSRQDYWSGLPFPSPGDLPDPEFFFFFFFFNFEKVYNYQDLYT